MSVTYSIKNMIHDEATGIVSLLQYEASKTDGQYTTNVQGIVRLDAPEGTPIPYDQLTPAIVDGWLSEKITAEEKARIEKNLDNQIAREKNPTPKQISGLPWNK